ncbi:MAG: hypothetical protein HYX53_01200 [Chloroflexi bacterium]|nr:hypothetical protein [Chloroflexota bacterium]
MKKRLMLGSGLAAAAMMAIPSLAVAQVPPGPPATFYGSAVGAAPGQGVIAIVINGSTSTTCGAGSVINDASGLVYVVDVISQDQQPGCGANGRTVRFYFTPASPTIGGSLANESSTWTGAGPKVQNLTPGSPLTIIRQAPMVASDGINY